MLCGQGHEAVFVSCRDRVTDTPLGPVTLTRTWCPCATYVHGFAPRNAGLSAADASMLLGQRAMIDRTAAAGPFARTPGLICDRPVHYAAGTFADVHVR